MHGWQQPRGNRIGAGWSSPVARQAHNLKVEGSNPSPAPNYFNDLTHNSNTKLRANFGFAIIYRNHSSKIPAPNTASVYFKLIVFERSCPAQPILQ